MQILIDDVTATDDVYDGYYDDFGNTSDGD